MSEPGIGPDPDAETPEAVERIRLQIETREEPDSGKSVECANEDHLNCPGYRSDTQVCLDYCHS